MSLNVVFGKVISVLEGPIIFTSPHGITVMRRKGVDEYDSHARERWASSVCMNLSKVMKKHFGGDSLILWNEKVTKAKDRENLDPNYLRKEQYETCSFHLNLEKFRRMYNSVFPLINFDVHGRAPQSGRICLEIGCAPYVSKWKKYSGGKETSEDAKKVKKVIIEELQKVFDKWNKIRKQKKEESYCDIPFTINGNPYFSGWWGGGLYTVSHQASQLGIAGFQLEMPPPIRMKLATDSEFAEDFGKAFVTAYEKLFLKRQEVKKILERISSGKKVNFDYTGYKKFVDAIDARNVQKVTFVKKKKIKK